MVEVNMGSLARDNTYLTIGRICYRVNTIIEYRSKLVKLFNLQDSNSSSNDNLVEQGRLDYKQVFISNIYLHLFITGKAYI
jgi:hypothetical protein